MSHFSVLVVTNTLDETELERLLMPFHEFECTGEDNEYVQEIDQTEEAIAEYAQAKTKMVHLLDGTKVGAYEERFYRPLNDEEHALYSADRFARDYTRADGTKFSVLGHDDDAKTKEYPFGAIEVDVMKSSEETFAEFVTSYYGIKWSVNKPKTFGEKYKYGFAYPLDPEALKWREGEHKKLNPDISKLAKEVRVIKRTNPNAKWDWYQIGGRFTGGLGAYNPSDDPANYENCFLCHGTGMRNDDLGRAARLANPDYTCNGCSGKGQSLKWPTHYKDVGNRVRVKDLNLAKLRDWKKAQHTEWYKEAEEAVTKTLAKPGEHDKEVIGQRAEWMHGVNPLTTTLDEFLIEAEKRPISAYATLDENGWHSKGDMGWWGVSTNEVEDWSDQVGVWLENLVANHPDKYLTIVDCHI